MSAENSLKNGPRPEEMVGFIQRPKEIVKNGWLEFIKRHKIKLSIAAIMSTSLGIGGYRIYQSHIKPFLDQKRELEQMLEQMEAMGSNLDEKNPERQKDNFDKHMRTGDMLLMNCRSELRKQICGLCNVEKLVNILKEGKKKDKIKTWLSLKDVCFTRIMLGLYGIILQNAFLKIQISIASRYSDSPDNNLAKTDDINKKYLEYFGHYSQVTGIKKMNESLQKVIVSVLGKLKDLKQKIHSDKLVELLKEIRMSFETFPKEQGSSKTNHFIKYLIPENSLNNVDDNHSDGELQFQQMVAETKNIIQTVSFWKVINNCLDNSFDILYKQIQAGAKGELPFANHIIFMSKEHLLSSLLPSKRGDLSKSELSLQLSKDAGVKDFCSVIYFPMDCSANGGSSSEENNHKRECIPRKQIKQTK